MTRPAFLLAALSLLAVLPALAQQSKAPPFMLSAEDRAQLDQKSKALADRLSAVQGATDAGVFLHVAQMADRLDLYANRNQVNSVLRGLDTGLQRAESLSQGKHSWTEQPGKSLRGYVSRIDNSIQPYGVTLPAGFDASKTYPLHVVLHGRGPTEVSFLGQMEPANPSQNKAPNQEFIELEPFGRANNGWRWAGETDVFEALDQVQRQYHIDPNRIVLRGFSMGGHGAWQIGVHYPTMWSAVSPGAGFTDTKKYQKIAAPVPPYEEDGWHIYDAVDYARNVFDSLFVGYGGEKDPQLQASLNMKEAAAKEGLDLKVIVGPGVEHRYHPDSFAEIMRLVQAPVRDPLPKETRFVTYTLKYNKCAWLDIDGLERHYERAQVDAKLDGSTVHLTTRNVNALSLTLPNTFTKAVLDGQKLPFVGSFQKREGKWTFTRRGGSVPPRLRKQHNLQGPIDDAFMERFLVVRPTGQAWHPATAEFADAGVKRFADEWRFGFRGELPVKDDREVTEADWKDTNLVLWGDPGSNNVMAKIAKSLPVKWTAEGLTVNGKSYGPDALPVLIFPNPLNHQRYVVINSGHTFNRKDLDASNAQLYPHLPDWAVIKPSGEVLAADYFDENWGFRR